MKTPVIIASAAVVAFVAAGAIYMVDIDQTSEGRLPTVDVSVDGGKLPKFDADVGSVSVQSEEVEVTVPKVKVVTEEETVSVPSVKVTPPTE